ncbi:MAG: beta-ketoacyl-[acyl-carrier-protein] synthase II [Desulfobacteraceae bacterium]|nr:MAG: beta-ketoacyl-[acyl-carrier-protein] synthase II [Desulfobacteraceae bacterium]
MKNRVVITGLGVVAPNGIGKEKFWEANLEGRSGVDRLTAFDASRFQTQIAAEVKNFTPAAYMPEETARRVDRFVHFGLASAKMAIEDSGLDLDGLDKTRAGVIIGSGLGGILFHEEQILATIEKGAHRTNPQCVPRITPNAVSAHIAIQHGLLGPNMVVSTACASGNHAIGEAFHKIQAGKASVLLGGGAEAPITPYTFGAFYSLRVLTRTSRPPREASRPFDNERDGFVMGEGAAVLVMEELEHALGRGARIYAEIIGYGMTSGAYHMVMPKPGGEDGAMTMKLALQDAGIGIEEVDYINAHGTSTKANDLAETQAIKEVFGEYAKRIPVSSTKSMIGHTIGAAGAIEAVASCLAIEHRIIPPTINHEHPDPECDLDYVPNMPRPGKVDVVLSNSFGFGSVNGSIVLRRYN